MEYHELKALAKGAKLKESVERKPIQFTVIRLFTWPVKHWTKPSHSLTEIRCTWKAKKVWRQNCPLTQGKDRQRGNRLSWKIVKVPQKYHVNRKFYINRNYQAGLPLWKQIGLGIFFSCSGSWCAIFTIGSGESPRHSGAGSVVLVYNQLKWVLRIHPINKTIDYLRIVTVIPFRLNLFSVLKYLILNQNLLFQNLYLIHEHSHTVLIYTTTRNSVCPFSRV